MEQKKAYKCIIGGYGKTIPEIIDHEIGDASGVKVIIPAIEVDICDICGEKSFGYEAALRLEVIKKRRGA